ncbi:uncharacterized protein DI49_3964 [Saccharomyces eubayanus]|uniref:uncharacterized protein n=1 Tax=Saccharomyces eubayanus TaxID=1080349 RepID=UPI0006C2F990|nr:hypothetical protein DI49_3964 [Saccharomyces eubayanus]KOG97227.1 hypothetical protein DI49_3964 [Saccharomyces eubayanus]
MYNVPPTSVSTVRRCSVSVTLVYQAYLDMILRGSSSLLFLSCSCISQLLQKVLL